MVLMIGTLILSTSVLKLTELPVDAGCRLNLITYTDYWETVLHNQLGIYEVITKTEIWKVGAFMIIYAVYQTKLT